MRMQQHPAEPNGRNLPQRRPRKKKGNLMQRFVENFVPNKNDSKADLIRKIVLIVAVIVLIGSVVYISSYYGESHSNREKNAVLQSMWEEITGGNVDVDSIDVPDGYPKDYLKKFAPLYEQNSDIAGWITIADSQVNYPVMQTDNNTDYDRTDFEKKSNQHGIPFVDYRVNLKKPSTNTIIYGHNMTDGQMFGELLNYKSLAYYQQHPLIDFDSVYGEGMYKIFGVVVCKADDPEFSYHNFIEANNNPANMNMETFITKVRERSLINSTVDVKTDDKILTLSTCDYSFRDPVTNQRIARFVIFARKVRTGEAETVDVANAKLNANPVMPAEWSQYIQKQQAEELKRQQEEEANKQYGPIREEAKKWFTEAELANIKDEDLEVEIARRKETMSHYLDSNELATLTAEEKLALLKERQEGDALLDQAIDAIYDNPDLDWMSSSEVEAFARELVKVGKSQWNAKMKEMAKAGEIELTLDKTTLTLVVGDSYELTADTYGGSGSVTWTSSNESVAKVSRGTVTARKKGTATITAIYSGRTATCKVTVTDEEVVETSISLPSSVEVAVGSTATIHASVTPDAMAEKGVTWAITSGKNYIEEIDHDGYEFLVKGVVAGKTAKITATTKDGKTATCEIKVVEAAVENTIGLNSTSLSLKKGETAVLKANITPSNSDVKWSISGSGVTIAPNGAECTVIAEQDGATAVVTATHGKDSSKKATCNVSVSDAAPSEIILTLDQTSLTLEIGKEAVLVASVQPAGTAVTWESSSPSVATVSDGIVVATGVGEATITVKAGGVSKTCKVTVVEGGASQPENGNSSIDESGNGEVPTL